MTDKFAASNVFIVVAGYFATNDGAQIASSVCCPFGILGDGFELQNCLSDCVVPGPFSMGCRLAVSVAILLFVHP